MSLSPPLETGSASLDALFWIRFGVSTRHQDLVPRTGRLAWLQTYGSRGLEFFSIRGDSGVADPGPNVGLKRTGLFCVCLRACPLLHPLHGMPEKFLHRFVAELLLGSSPVRFNRLPI